MKNCDQNLAFSVLRTALADASAQVQSVLDLAPYLRADDRDVIDIEHIAGLLIDVEDTAANFIDALGAKLNAEAATD